MSKMAQMTPAQIEHHLVLIASGDTGASEKERLQALTALAKIKGMLDAGGAPKEATKVELIIK